MIEVRPSCFPRVHRQGAQATLFLAHLGADGADRPRHSSRGSLFCVAVTEDTAIHKLRGQLGAVREIGPVAVVERKERLEWQVAAADVVTAFLDYGFADSSEPGFEFSEIPAVFVLLQDPEGLVTDLSNRAARINGILLK